MAGLGRRSGGVSRREHRAASPERAFILAGPPAARPAAGLGRRAALCRASPGGRIGGVDRRAEEYALPAVPPCGDERLPGLRRQGREEMLLAEPRRLPPRDALQEFGRVVSRLDPAPCLVEA